VGIYKSLVRPVLFKKDPEEVHHLVTKWLKLFFSFPVIRNLYKNFFQLNDKKLEYNVIGINFPNRVGLAAGFDKDAKMFKELGALGFGFIEVGTVTPLPQPGNDKPRMFRLPEDEALINRMGFNNDGVVAMSSLLRNRNKNIIIGGNIGKNKNTSQENAIHDYEKCFRELFEYVDYFVVNVSSPNTPGLRALQEKEPLLAILNKLQQVNIDLSKNQTRNKPLLLKIAPDLTNEQLNEIIEVVMESKLDGVIATNTTVSRENLITSKEEINRAGAGGLSGKPLRERSTEVIKFLKDHSENKFIIIGSGGIHSPDDAIEKLKAGADLIQLYTGFIYEGPSLIKQINQALLKN
jgi:dihydroorotate dehydrogenase